MKEILKSSAMQQTEHARQQIQDVSLLAKAIGQNISQELTQGMSDSLELAKALSSALVQNIQETLEKAGQSLQNQVEDHYFQVQKEQQRITSRVDKYILQIAFYTEALRRIEKVTPQLVKAAQYARRTMELQQKKQFELIVMSSIVSAVVTALFITLAAKIFLFR